MQPTQSSFGDTATSIVVFDIDGVLRDVSQSYRRAIADTVEYFTQNAYRPSLEEIDRLKSEGIWNNDWEASAELVCRYGEAQGKSREQIQLNFPELIDFFQSRYRGDNDQQWNGYITQEPVLVTGEYFQNLLQAQIPWGFFSGAMRAEAEYLLQKHVGIAHPILIAMEDAPGKPDPRGLFLVCQQLQQQYNFTNHPPVIYVGDTVGDMYVVQQARRQDSSREWIGVGVLPPHAQTDTENRHRYTEKLQQAGAAVVLEQVLDLTPDAIEKLIADNDAKSANQNHI